jgi:hypothetical protein
VHSKLRWLALLTLSCVALGCRKDRVVTFKAGGAASGTIRYQLGAEDVTPGDEALPWSKTLRAGRSVDSARINVSAQWGSPAWCEVWIDDQLCDREDDGVWCSCYYDRRKGWSGWPNDDRANATHIR